MPTDQWGYPIDGAGNCAWPSGSASGLEKGIAYEACQTKHHGPIQIAVQGFNGAGATYLGRAPTPQAALVNLLTGPQSFRDTVQTAIANQPREIFPGAVALGDIAVNIGLQAVGIPAWLVNTTSFAAQTSQQYARDPNMAINLGGLIGGLGSIAGSFGGQIGNPYLQGIGSVAQAFGGAFSSPAVAAPTSYVPYSPPPSYPVATMPRATPVMASGQALGYSARMAASITTPILYKIYSTIGKKVSLQAAVSIIRKMGKFLMSPEAIAVALGISVAELAQVITSASAKKRRTMNPANGKALRRAARRIKGFHRMCGTVDLLKSRGKRSSFRSSCGTCKKSPCRC
jgi:hypothetical protein